jgi:hypothetical protein
MAHCHAAVILLSEKALGESQWVLKEATILRWRDSLEALNGRKSGFQLIPVFLGVRSAQVDAAPEFGPLKLSEASATRKEAGPWWVRAFRKSSFFELQRRLLLNAPPGHNKVAKSPK